MIIHVVKSGETLWSISRKYGVGINSITTANGIDNADILVVGQSLVIPTGDNFHTVVPGESLWSIAARYGVSVQDIIRANNITNPNLIYAGQVLKIPKPTIEVNGYLTQMGTYGDSIINSTGKYLTYVSVFSYKVLPDGNMIQMNDASVLTSAKNNSVVPLMTLTNFSGRKFSSDLAHTVLSENAVQDRLLANIVSVMKGKGYRGLNIDFEYVYPADRELYNQFLRKAADVMHRNGYSISTALAPKISANQPGLLYEAHDYPVHGQLDDFVVLMTYEWGYAAGPPWAIAPINEVKRVLNYAVTVIPRSKILMGIPLYGRDWKLPYVAGTTIAQTITNKIAVERAAKYGVDIHYDELYQSPYYNYTDESGNQHIVWFEDARSFDVKYKTIRQYGLRGASYWELNPGSPQNWPVLADNFNTRKLA